MVYFWYYFENKNAISVIMNLVGKASSVSLSFISWICLFIFTGKANSREEQQT